MYNWIMEPRVACECHIQKFGPYNLLASRPVLEGGKLLGGDVGGISTTLWNNFR